MRPIPTTAVQTVIPAPARMKAQRDQRSLRGGTYGGEVSDTIRLLIEYRY